VLNLLDRDLERLLVNDSPHDAPFGGGGRRHGQSSRSIGCPSSVDPHGRGRKWSRRSSTASSDPRVVPIFGIPANQPPHCGRELAERSYSEVMTSTDAEVDIKPR